MASTSRSAQWSGDSRFSLIMNLNESYVSGGVDNYSNVDWNLQLSSTSEWRTYSYEGICPLTGNVNGQTVCNQNINYDLQNNTITVASGTVRVPHNSDGSKTISFSASFTDSSNGKGTASLSGTLNLTKIARYATMNSAGNFNDEQNPSFTFSNPANTSMSCWLEPKPNGEHLAERNFSGTSGTYTWELTEEERNQLIAKCTDGNSCKCRIGLYSTLGGSIQASYKDITMTIINAEPSFENFDFNDVNATTIALTGNSKNCITGYSNIMANITEVNKAVAMKQATMVKYRFVVGNQSIDIPYSSSGNVTGTINGAENGTFEVYAIDSRGNSTKVTKLANEVIQYEPIYINKSTSKVDRNSSGVGEYAILTYNGTIWNDDFGQVVNSIKSASYEYKATDSSTWITPSSPTDITPTLTNNTFNFNDLIRSNESDYKFDLQKSYDFRITIEDELSTTTVQLTPMPSGTPNICYADDGVSIMGDYNESLNSGLQVNGKLYVNGIDILNALYPVGSIYMSVNSTSPSTFFGGTWEQLKDRFLLGAGDTYSNGATGGSATHTLTVNEIPSHSHQQRGFKMFSRSSTDDYAVSWGSDDDGGGSYTRETGGGQPHSIMPPYLVVYMWKRTA